MRSMSCTTWMPALLVKGSEISPTFSFSDRVSYLGAKVFDHDDPEVAAAPPAGGHLLLHQSLEVS